jgi:hypothetical protein
MYARVTTFHADPARLDEMNEIRESIKADLKLILGLQVTLASWNDEGKGSVTAIYDNQASADAAAVSVQGVWGKMAGVLLAPPSVEGYSNVDNMLV